MRPEIQNRKSKIENSVSHYKPKPAFRSNDAARHCPAFYAALEPWLQEALTGQKRNRIPSHLSAAINRSADDLLCDCAAALAEAVEWEGALLAHRLALRGWPVDVALVRLCHTWSTSLMDRIMADWRERQKSEEAC